MPRNLWLKAERTSKSEAILHPATADQVALALEFFEASASERQATSDWLKLWLERQRMTSPAARHSIPCHRPQGLFVLLPWRLAAWLVRVWESSPNTVNEVQERLSRWLSGHTEQQTGGEENKHPVAQPSLLG